MTDKEIVFRASCYAINELVQKGSNSFYTKGEDGIPHIMTWVQVVEKLMELCEVKK